MEDAALAESEIINTYKAMRQECQNLVLKIGELQLEREEHDLVLNTLEPLDESRKAFRLIGGVLVERTVGEVRPSVQENMIGIQQLIAALEQQLQRKDAESQAWKEKYGIATQSEMEAKQRAAAASKPRAQVEGK